MEKELCTLKGATGSYGWYEGKWEKWSERGNKGEMEQNKTEVFLKLLGSAKQPSWCPQRCSKTKVYKISLAFY